MKNCISLFLLAAASVMTCTVHRTACTSGAAGVLSLLFLTHEVYGDGDNNGYQYNANKDSGKVCGKKTYHGNHPFMKKLSSKQI